ncbi:hypothetical protein [Synechococcus sp. CS-1328]|uniref:hypothetical protein n=1 Tax=Synechococcus sp. CS-1328 TaxID=2847976 RepID=UPI00223BE34B|nr:hypothetical protein [Synechococcus sp. CS-1328]MCT0225263.1 diguanylate cyclase [Synechococcus sp. CS-1328]
MHPSLTGSPSPGHGLLRCLRRDDLAARLGGDELLVMVFGIQDLANAEALAETILIAAAEPIDSLMQQADQAMYEAKRLGRNRLVPLQPPAAVLERPT